MNSTAFYIIRHLWKMAYLTESDEFPELLRYCNLLYEVFPYELAAAVRDVATASKVRNLQEIAMVAEGDMAAIWMMTEWMTFLMTWTLTATARYTAT